MREAPANAGADQFTHLHSAERQRNNVSHVASLLLLLALGLTTSASIASAQEDESGQTMTEIVEVDGEPRSALIYVPGRLPKDILVPVIFFFHGGGHNASGASRNFAFNLEADARGFIAIYPDGTETPPDPGRRWNDGTLRLRELSDDVGFFDRLLDLLLDQYSVDPNQVFVSGQSNGGGMAYRLACERSEQIAAIGVSAAQFFAPVCAPGVPLAVLHVHGTDDPINPFAGTVTTERGALPPVHEVIDFWSRHNGCSGQLLEMLNPVVERQSYSPCLQGTEVVLHTVLGGGHCWPGILLPPRSDCPPDGPHMSFSATALVTDFLLAHPRS